MSWRHITRARQMLASEQGAIVKDWGGQLPIVLAYPNSYSVGMSSLAIHGLYRWFNALPGVVCERAFNSLGRRAAQDEPLITLESQRPVRDAAVLALSASFEMDYFNIVSMLRRAGIPARAEERDEGDPLVIVGGPAASANPEPLALLADAIVIGEAEPILADLVEAMRGAWTADRLTILSDLSKLPGIYVPAVHDGRPIQRQWLRHLDDYPIASSIVAPEAEFGDMHLIEISRGCGHGCRFCLAGYWYRPPRERSLASILEQAQQGLKQWRKVGLVASAVSDYSQINALAMGLQAMGATISVSSLRIRPLSPVLLRVLAEGGARSITLAPEAGSERLRQVIHKGVSHDDIIKATAMVADHPFQTLKLYFMLGLPSESDQDIEDLLDLVGEIKAIFDRHIVVSVTPFVPKAHTPFQRAGLMPKNVLKARLKRIRAACHKMRIEMRSESIDAARVQAVLSRGDRQVGQALLAMADPSRSHFEHALREQGIDLAGCLQERAVDEALPWDFIAV